jgi:hypothetical protein
MKDFTQLDFPALWRGKRGDGSPVKLVGIRGAFEAAGQPNQMKIYDDVIIVIIDDEATQWQASTDPSWPLVVHAINLDGAAQLCPGIHLFQKHLLHGKRPCLGQAENVHVNRLDPQGRVKETVSGDFGICIHSGGAGMDTGRFSAGCQIIANRDGYFMNPTWERFWGPIRDAMSAKKLATVPYLLINASDLPGAPS